VADQRPIDLTVTALNPTKVVSVRMFRAKMLDGLVGRAVRTTPDFVANVPFDIDDLEATDAAVLGGVNFDRPGSSAADVIRRHSQGNPLNWQRSGDTDYLKNLRTFRRNAKQLYVDGVGELLGAVTDPAMFNQQVLQVDLTPFTTVSSITRDLSFGNRCGLNVSLIGLRATQNADPSFQVEQDLGDNLEAVPRENDVIEIIAEYPDGRLDRWFLGLVSVVEYEEQQGTITTVTVTCHGISKLLMLNRMVTDRSITDQFEDGSLPTQTFSMFGGPLREKTVDQIFASLMVGQMAMRVSDDTTSNQGVTTLMLEATVAQEKAKLLDTRVRELTRFVSQNTSEVLVKKEVARRQDEIVTRWAADQPIGFDTILAIERQVQQDLGPRLTQFLSASGPNAIPADEQTDAAEMLLADLSRQRLTKRVERLVNGKDGEILKAGQKKLNQPPDDVRINFTFDLAAFSTISEFQFSYVPLLTMMAVRSRTPAQDDPDANDLDLDQVARFRGRRARAFDLTIQSGFESFFSQLSYPADILNSVRTAAKFAVYENERNQIVCEIPRYNEFGADEDEGELVEDFIILNPQSVKFSRNDTGLLARQDVRGYIPIIPQGEPTIGRFLMGQFTDPAALLRYGMRADDPAYNPNVQSAKDPFSAAVFAAIELTIKNADTRTMEVTFIADRPIRTGRVYFVARTSLERMMGGAPDEVNNAVPVDTDGYIGYLSQAETIVQHGAPTVHKLSLRYVRKARLLALTNGQGQKTGYVANFRVLPDIRGLMDALEQQTKDGTRDPDVLKKTPPPPTTGVVGVLIDEATNDQYYGATIFLPDDGNKKFLSLNFMTLATDFTGDRPNLTTSPWVTHHQSLAPGVVMKPYATPPDACDLSNNRLAVVKVTNSSDGLQRQLINNVALVDLRLRALNAALFMTQQVGSGNSLIPAPPIKRTVFEVLYVPNEVVNRHYRLVGLGGLRMTIVSIFHSASKTVLNSVINGTNITGFDTGVLVGDFSIVSGVSFKASDPAPHFAVLRFTRRNVNNAAPSYTVTVAQLQAATNVVASVVGTVSSIPPATVQAIIDDLSSLPSDDQTQSIFVPVVFHNLGPTNKDAFLNVVDPGIPLSIYDAAYDFPSGDFKFTTSPLTFSGVHVSSTFRFSGVLPVPAGTETRGNDQLKHGEGNALDVTVFPWIARTGIRLKPMSIYVLDPAYGGAVEAGEHAHSPVYQGGRMLTAPVRVQVIAPAPPAPAPAPFQVAQGEIGLSPTVTGQAADCAAKNERVAAPVQDLKALGGALHVVKKSSSVERTVAQTAFQGLVDSLGINTVFAITDLHDNDRVFWHVGA
jgi:hypothetical protein